MKLFLKNKKQIKLKKRTQQNKSGTKEKTFPI